MENKFRLMINSKLVLSLQIHWDEISELWKSQLNRFASFFGKSRAVTCLPRFTLCAVHRHTADKKYGGCRHRIASYGAIMTQREYCTCGCSLSRPTLERLSWQRRRTRTRSLRIMNCVRVLGYVTWQNRIRKLLHSVVTFSVASTLAISDRLLSFFGVSSGVPESPVLLFSLHGDPSFTSSRLVKHYDFSTA